MWKRKIIGVGMGLFTVSLVACSDAPSPETLISSAPEPLAQIYRESCATCHNGGMKSMLTGAPRLGDQVAFADTLARGLEPAIISVLKGKGGMPARGEAIDATDAELRLLVQWMLKQAEPSKAASAHGS